MDQPSFDLFINLAMRAMPTDAFAIFSGGYSTSGIGLATYVADSVANSSLATSYPNFCNADSTGRYFRLVPQDGIIAISQGGALGGTHNDQPAIQAAINYAAAIGARVLLFDFDTVSLWMSTRTTNVTTTASDGHALVITKDIELCGCASGTTLTLLNSTGGAYSTVTQTVAGSTWYGGGIFIWPAGNGTGVINRLTITRLTVTGGVGYTLSGSAPAGNTGPGQTGVNPTSKGFWAQGVTINNLYFNDCEFWGFYAEVTYLGMTGANSPCNVYVNNLRVHDSPQSVWNPAGISGVNSGQAVKANGLICYSSYGVEIVGGPGQTYNNCKFYNLAGLSATGGPANGLLYNYAYPTRVATVQPPWLDFITCEFSNIAQIIVGNYIRIIRGRATDCLFYMVTGTALAGGNGSLVSTYIDIDYYIDVMTQSPIFAILGPPNLMTLIPGASGSNYIKAIADLDIRVNVHRTAQAITNGYYAIAFAFSGEFDPNSCKLGVGRAAGLSTVALPNYGGATPVSQPLVTCDEASDSFEIGSGSPYAMLTLAISSRPYSIQISNPRHGLVYTGTAVAIACTISAPFTYPAGQKSRLYWYGSTAGTTYTFAHNGSGLRLNSDCTLALFGDWLEVEFNPGTRLWHEIGRSIHAA